MIDLSECSPYNSNLIRLCHMKICLNPEYEAIKMYVVATHDMIDLFPLNPS